MDESTSRPRINWDVIIHSIKIDPLTFDDIFNSEIFSDWIADLDYYFDWYKFTKESKIQFAKMRLTGLA